MAAVPGEHVAEMAATAYSIITSQAYDYFDSRSQGYKDHAEFEGIPKSALERVGVDTVKMPRLYKAEFESDLQKALILLDEENHEFLYSDRYTLVHGKTRADDDLNDEVPPCIKLSVPLHKHSVGVVLPNAEARVKHIMPDSHRPRPYTPEEEHTGPLELRLGRSLLNGDTLHEDIPNAARQVYRPWETVIAIGRPAIKALIDAMYDEEALNGIADQSIRVREDTRASVAERLIG